MPWNVVKSSNAAEFVCYMLILLFDTCSQIVYLMLDGNCYSYKTINLRYYHNSEKWDVHICLYFDLLMVSFMWMFYCIIWFLICSKCDTSLSFIIVWSEPRQQLAGRGSVVPEGEVWGCAWQDLQAGGDGFSVHLYSPWSMRCRIQSNKATKWWGYGKEAHIWMIGEVARAYERGMDSVATMLNGTRTTFFVPILKYICVMSSYSLCLQICSFLALTIFCEENIL